MIYGVTITPLKQIRDNRGVVMHMLRSDSPHYINFGEIYFSAIFHGVVKAWKLHKVMTLNYAVPVGCVKVVLYDQREDSPTFGKFNEFIIGPDNYCLITVPPLIWSGVKGISQETSLIANCATICHDPSEVEILDRLNDIVVYNWD